MFLYSVHLQGGRKYKNNYKHIEFNNVADKNGIIQQQEITTGLGLTAISGDSSLLAYFTNLTNIWLNIVNFWIEQSQGEWPYDDNNYAGFPFETFAFVNNQQDYGLSEDGEKSSLMIKRVKVQEVSSNKWYDLEFCFQKDIIADWTGQAAGRPSKYWLNGKSLILDRKVDTSIVDYYQLIYDRNAHVFAVDDTDAEPGFDIKFQPILVYGPSMEYAMRINKAEVVNLCRMMLYGSDARRDKGLKEMLERFYSDRAKESYKLKSRYIGYR